MTAAELAPVTARPATRDRSRVLVLSVILFAIVFAVDVASPSGMTADSIRGIPTAVSLVYYHTISLDHLQHYLINPGVAETVVGHHIYPLFPWTTYLFAVPWVVADLVLHKLGIGGGPMAFIRSTHDWELQVLTASTVVAASAVVVFRIALRMLRLPSVVSRRRWAFSVALVFAFATPAWSTASRSLWEHGPSMLCLSVALLLAVRARDGLPGWFGMGFALGASYTIRPTDAIVVAAVGLWVLACHRRQVLRVIAGGVIPIAAFMAVNMATYHVPLTPYFTQGQSFAITPAMASALAGNLVSPARGLFIFCPLVLLSVAGVYLKWRRRQLDGFWIALAVIAPIQWVVISAFKHWWGGDSFGPRFFTDLFPIFVVLAIPAVEELATRTSRRRVARHRVFAGLTAVALVWSLGVNAQGAILRSAWCWNNEPTDVDLHPSKLWQWSDPQFARGMRTLIWGPNRASEVMRDGVDLMGCPTEPVRP